jgi:hypothetical protein
LFSNNLTTQDNNRYPRTTADAGQTTTGVGVEATPWRGIALGNIGFINLQLDSTGNPSAPPASAHDWTLAPTSPYYASATDGGPLGAIR